MEVFLKFIITLTIVFIAMGPLLRIWTNHFEPKKSAQRMLKTLSIVFEVGETVSITFVVAASLWWMWTSQIDLKETARRMFVEPPAVSEVIASRDPNKIYQNGKEVAEVTGKVERRDDGNVTFEELFNSSNLDRKLSFEYGRETLEIVSTGDEVRLDFGHTPARRDVVRNVVCREIR